MRKPSVFYTFPYGITSLVKVRLFSWKHFLLMCIIAVLANFISAVLSKPIYFVALFFAENFGYESVYIYWFRFAIEDAFIIFACFTLNQRYASKAFQSIDFELISLLPSSKKIKEYLFYRSAFLQSIALIIIFKINYISDYLIKYWGGPNLFSRVISHSGLPNFIDSIFLPGYYLEFTGYILSKICLYLIVGLIYVRMRLKHDRPFIIFLVLLLVYYLIFDVYRIWITLTFFDGKLGQGLSPILRLVLWLPIAYLLVRNVLKKFNATED